MIGALSLSKRAKVLVWLFDVEMTTSKTQINNSRTETILSDLADKSNRPLMNFYMRKFITEKEFKYFSYDFKKYQLI